MVKRLNSNLLDYNNLL